MKNSRIWAWLTMLAGATYFFLPLAGAVAAVIWLIWSAPSQIATRNGG